MPTSAPSAVRAPSAIARAASGDTAPYVSIISAGTPSSDVLAPLEYDTMPPSTYADDPGRSTSRPASSPPVHDSAGAARPPPPRSAPPGSPSGVRPAPPARRAPGPGGPP